MQGRNVFHVTNNKLCVSGCGSCDHGCRVMLLSVVYVTERRESGVLSGVIGLTSVSVFVKIPSAIVESTRTSEEKTTDMATRNFYCTLFKRTQINSD